MVSTRGFTLGALADSRTARLDQQRKDGLLREEKLKTVRDNIRVLTEQAVALKSSSLTPDQTPVETIGNIRKSIQELVIASQKSLGAAPGLASAITTFEAALQATKTQQEIALEKGVSEATSQIAQSETLQAGGASTGAASEAAGFGEGNVQTLTFKMPDGSVREVRADDTDAVNRAIAEKGFTFNATVQASGTGALTGESPKDVRGIRASIRDSQANIEELQATAKAFAETPEAGGVLGAVLESAGGLLEQIPVFGEGLADALPGDQEAVTAARTQARITVSSLLSTITGEESGRFTDTERRLANEALKALEATSSPTQIQSALKTSVEIMQRSQLREVNRLLDASKADISDDEGAEAFFGVLKKNGFSDDAALDAILALREARGLG